MGWIGARRCRGYHRTRRVGLACTGRARRRYGVQINLGRYGACRGVQLFLQARVELAEACNNRLRPQAELRRAPWRLLYKPSRDEINNLVLFDATRQFAEGANDLSDASGALRDAMQNPNLDPATAQKLVDELQRSFDKFKDVESKLWKEAK